MQKKIGRYEIKSELGRGGMATVYRAYDPNFSRDVAIKVLPPHFLHDPSFKQRFLTEARMIATLEHPTIVPVYDFGASDEQDEAPFIVMRLLEGGSLRDRLDEYGALPLTEAARILNRLAPALDFAHKRGVIHRDLKPGNIMFDSEGEPYLADFGIARLAEATQTMTIVGTPAFMSPEQWEGNRKLDGRSDLYALGVVFFEMLTGSRPFVSDTPAGLMRAHLMEPVPDILLLKQDLPTKCQPVIEKALAKSRDQRYQTAQSLASAVQILATGGDLPSHLFLDKASDDAAASNVALSQAAGSAQDAYQGVTIGPNTIAADPPMEPPESQSPAVPTGKKRRWWPWLVGLMGVIGLGACAFFVVVGGALSLAETPTATPRQLPTDTPRANRVAPSGESVVPLGFDQAYEGWIAPDSSVFFEVPVGRDRQVLVMAISPSLTDLIMIIYDEDGNQLEEVDLEFGEEAEVAGFPISAADTIYTVELRSFEGDAGEYLIGYGELEITANNVVAAEVNTLTEDGALEYGIDLQADEALFVFLVPEGEVLDVVLYIEDEFGNEYIFTDTGLEGEWEAYLLYPEKSGQFFVVAEAYDVGGDYRIFILRLPVTELN